MIFQEPLTALNPVFTVGNQLADGATDHPVHERITVYPLKNLGELPAALDARGGQKVTSAGVQ